MSAATLKVAQGSPEWEEIVAYDPATGILSWRVKRPGPQTRVGGEVGSVKSDGRYRSFVYKHRRYYTHRVIWELARGPIPTGMCIDHIDGNGLNNRLENLRVATLSGNQRNRRLNKNSTLGVSGIANHRGGFSVSCANKYIGWTKDFFEACCLRKAAEIKHGYLVR